MPDDRPAKPLPASTDDQRDASPLRHVLLTTFDGPIDLELGGVLPSVTIAYETYGTLNADRSNAVLVCHALSGDSHVASHGADDEPGWWDAMVGPGKPIDTDRYFVICSNVLGGCRGTTGPWTTDRETGRPWGADFPPITLGDMVAMQKRLIDQLGIAKLRGIVGGSLGAHQTLTWAIRHRGSADFYGVIAGSARLASQALSFDVVGRNAITRDPHFHDGQYYDQPTGPDVGLAIARMLGHITYLSPEAMNDKFDPDRHQPHDLETAFEKKFSVGSYLAYQGSKFVERFDANSYITLSMAMDLFDLGRTPQQLADSLSQAHGRFLVASFASDWLFPPSQSVELANALLAHDLPVTYCEVRSDAGHDGFLLPNEIGRYGELIRAGLEDTSPASQSTNTAAQSDASPSATEPPTGTPSIYQGKRLDDDLLLGLIEPGDSVLDLGCGDGALLGRLKQRGHDKLMGIDVDEPHIIATAKQGIPVIDHDLNLGLPMFADGRFDVVVLSQTLQAVHNVEAVIDAMVRVGRRAIVSFPNFGFRAIRQMLSEDGRSPKADGPFGYEWYSTPNRRFPTIADFQDLCDKKQLVVDQQRYLDTAAGQTIEDDPNLNADVAIFVIRRPS